MYPTIPAIIAQQAHICPQAVAYCMFEGNELTETSYASAWQQITQVADNFSKHQVKGKTIAIIGENTPRWETIAHATNLSGGTVLGLSPFASNKVIADGLKAANAEILIAEDTSLYENLSDRFKIISFSTLFNSINNESSICSLDSLSADLPAWLFFTSGTSGKPKLISYSHTQIVTALTHLKKTFADLPQDARTVSWLPLNNPFQRIVNLCALSRGSKIYFVRNPNELMPQINRINPTVLIGVPRFFEKVIEEITLKTNENLFLKKSLSFTSRKIHPLSPLRVAQYVLKQTLFRKIKNVFGNDLRWLISGSAPLSQQVLDFFKEFNLHILEAYGASECITPIALNTPKAFRDGSVGKSYADTLIKCSKDREIFIKSSGLFNGYSKSQEKLRLDSDGFFCNRRSW